MTLKARHIRNAPGLIPLLALVFSTQGVAAQTAYTLSPQNIVQNGSFELYTGRLPPTYWTGSFGLMLGFSEAADGRNFADISYASDFAAQTLATVPGQAYHVSFAVSGNSSYPGESIVQLSWGGTVVGNTTWVSPYTPGNGLNLNWVYGSFDVPATSSSTLISFQRNPASTSAGTWLDAVQVLAIPEPTGACLLSFGTLVAIWRLRKDVTSAHCQRRACRTPF